MSKTRRAFSLVEVGMALAILAMIAAGTLAVVNRCIESAIAGRAKEQAFEIARENMEAILGGGPVGETAEFGYLEENPDVEWETVVEVFNEPATSKMWSRALCSASYTDSAGERQSIELENWLGKLSDEQVKQVAEQKKREMAFMQQLKELGIEDYFDFEDKDKFDNEDEVDRGDDSQDKDEGTGGAEEDDICAILRAIDPPVAEDLLRAFGCL